MNERLKQWFRDQAADVLAKDYARLEDAPGLELDQLTAAVRFDEDGPDGVGAWVTVEMFLMAPLDDEPVDEDGVPL